MTLVQFLVELEQNHQSVTISGPEVERLAKRFGPTVRTMGVWHKTGDGSLEIPMGNIAEAARSFDDRSLSQAVAELQSPDQLAPDQLANVLYTSSAAGKLIEMLSEIYLNQFQSRVEQFQSSNNPAQTEQLRSEISRELFGS